MSSPSKFTSIGGQAVIEGVMMRSPHFIAVAVRKPDQRIVIRNLPYSSITQKIPMLRRPVFRGVVMLIESMSQGVNALSFSANVSAASESDKGVELSSWAIAGSLAFAFALGMGMFVALPHFLTALLVSNRHVQLTAQSPFFHIIDGILKTSILLTYVYVIALMKDIHRVFQYHGAEHKSIYTFEAGEDLTVENARKHTTLHPRCGTSFLLFLVMVSIVVFSFVFPLFHLTELSSIPIVNHALMVLFKIILMFPVAGLSYELIKISASRMDNPFFRLLAWPGLALQKLTTREPTDDQLEVALASLRQVLYAEKQSESKVGEFEIAGLAEIAWVPATVAEFPEA